MDVRLPIKKGIYNENGALMATETLFDAPSIEETQRIETFIKKNLVNNYFMVFPWSNHPHHRKMAQVFLNAIAKYNPTAAIYFWADDKEFPQHHLRANTYLLYGKGEERFKELMTFNGNTSQVDRTKWDGRGWEYYCRMSENMSQQAFEAAQKVLENRGMTDNEVKQYVSFCQFADRFIKCSLQINDELCPATLKSA